MKVSIEKNGKSGTLLYDPHEKEVLVNHPDDNVRRAVHQYLTTERNFTVPASNDPNVSGSRMTITGTPVHHISLLDMALNELHSETGVRVNWGHDDNKGGSLSGDANKPISKSLGDGSHYILE